MLSDQTERRVVAFVRSVANDCCSCNRRSDYNCDHCHSLWANSLMREIELDVGGKTKEIDYSLAARIGKIMLALKTNGRPMMSREINLEGTCSFQLKLWTLKHMVKKGIIGRRVARRSNNKNYYFYFLKPNNAENVKNTNVSIIKDGKGRIGKNVNKFNKMVLTAFGETHTVSEW